ncbi:hypothetical protein GCM10011491_41460 [Brucella endophytica]|uniref:Uncharacterized protein n=2 Tax=Brucella endophytica TaxID=1963359 RepID=A0A916SR43_9HYPH|nr:hypothetical protein GCM10011491_41460 [Brucella endophytica]
MDQNEIEQAKRDLRKAGSLLKAVASDHRWKLFSLLLSLIGLAAVILAFFVEDRLAQLLLALLGLALGALAAGCGRMGGICEV